jgi:hypothetical protein
MPEPDLEPNDRRPTPHQLATWTVLGAVVAAGLALSSARCSLGPETARAYPSRTLPAEPAPSLLATSGPDEDYYPCTDCHEDEPTDRTVRALEDDHDDIELAHGDLWCLHCHEVDDRDALHLTDGQTTSFEESWRLCTQCHGEKLADWRAGVHGKREGNWWGPKQYWSCVACHAPHAPRFAPIEAMPPPRRPRYEDLSAHAHTEETAGE